MCIRFGVYWPKSNIHIEDAFKCHVQEHAPRNLNLISQVATPGLKKYVVGRVTEVSVGRPLFTNYVKMWWDDESAMNMYLQARQAPELQVDNFANMVEWGFTASVEESVNFENSATLGKKPARTRLGVYWPRGNIYTKDAYKIHYQNHAPGILKLISEVATPGLQKYINGYVTKVSVGRPLFTNYVQMWWDDESAMNKYLEAHQVPQLQADDFANMVEWAFTAFVEEEVIFEKK